MKRLWDKGEPLDERILRYTAGEDHLLDGRLVAHDVRASIAHAQMLHQQGLLSATDLAAIVQGLDALAASHAAGDWEITLEDEDCHTALEQRRCWRARAAAPHRQHRRCRRARAPGPVAQ
jgi:argininosuccinate lyase